MKTVLDVEIFLDIVNMVSRGVFTTSQKFEHPIPYSFKKKVSDDKVFTLKLIKLK